MFSYTPDLFRQGIDNLLLKFVFLNLFTNLRLQLKFERGSGVSKIENFIFQAFKLGKLHIKILSLTVQECVLRLKTTVVEPDFFEFGQFESK